MQAYNPGPSYAPLMALTVDDTLPATPENVAAVRSSRDHLNRWLAAHGAAEPADAAEVDRLKLALHQAASRLEETEALLDASEAENAELQDWKASTLRVVAALRGGHAEVNRIVGQLPHS